MSKHKPTDLVWSGIVDAVTLSAASSVVATLTGGLFANLLTDQVINWLGKDRKNQHPETALEVLERAKSELAAAMHSIAQLEETAKSAQIEATDLQTQIQTLKTDKAAAQLLLQADREAVVKLIGEANSRGRVRGAVEGLFVGIIASLAATAIWLFATQT